MPTTKLWTRDFIAVCFSAFFQLIIFTTFMATLSLFVKDTLKGDDQQAGLALTFFFLGAVLSRPLAGKWLSRFDNRLVLLFSLAAFLAATVLYPAVASLTGLFTLRFAHGLAFGIANTASTAIAAQLIPERRKGEGMGFYTTSLSLALVLGPLCGLSLVAAFDFSTLFETCILLGALSLVCGIAVRAPGPTAGHIAAGSDRPLWASYFEPSVVPVALSGALLSLVFGGIVTFVPIYAQELGIQAYARHFFFAYAIVLLVSRPLAGKIFDRLGASTVYYPTIVCYLLGLLFLGRTDGPVLLILAGVLIGLGYGTLFSLLQTVALQLVPAHRQGVAAGTYFLLWDCGTGLGAYVLGIVASVAGYGTMYLLSTTIVLVSAALFVYGQAKSRDLSRPVPDAATDRL